MALARLGVATCMIFSPMFAELGGHVSVARSVAFGVVLLMIALIMFIVYFFMDKKLDEQTHAEEEKDDPFKISDLGKNPYQRRVLACSTPLRALLLSHLPLPEICRKYAPVQPDADPSRQRIVLGN